jgi:hypothetical protein
MNLRLRGATRLRCAIGSLHYFDTSAAVVAATVYENLPPLVDAARRLARRLRDTASDGG